MNFWLFASVCVVCATVVFGPIIYGYARNKLNI